MAEHKEYDNHFRPLPVAELLTGNFHFDIPSFQRGYRWERKQVIDLLEDIFSFSKSKEQLSYYLQPIVVKKAGDKWEVLDGQQRLTSMLLVLLRIFDKMLTEDEKEEFSNGIYKITYKIRPQLDFRNPDFRTTIDGFYLAEAKETIDRWFTEKRRQRVNLDDFKKCLLYPDSEKQVKFIWYESTDEDGNGTELNSIKVFNRLNKGKIGLTSSELIKALFVLDLEEFEISTSITDESASGQLVMEWNEIERKFQDDRFWYFISNDQHNVQTRIDLLFDFLTGKGEDDDSDYSYRMFQNLFDSYHSTNITLNALWSENGITSMKKAWREVKKTFDRLVAWYDDNMYYHYVGFLISQGSSPMAIHRKLQCKKDERRQAEPDHEWTVSDTEKELKTMIKAKFRNKNTDFKPEDIDKLEYSNGGGVRRLLLLFNVELGVKTDNQRFNFDAFKKEHWDIEHVDSQSNSCLQKPEDRLQWLRNVAFILKVENSESAEGRGLLSECTRLITELEALPAEKLVFSNEVYFKIYEKTNKYFSFDPAAGDRTIESVDLTKKDKDNIGNLTLLNSDINRSYKDAPFPYKRYYVMDKDKEGFHFIPIGTRSLFLKYFTSSETSVSQLQMFRWNEADRISYLEYIHTVIDPFFI